MKSFRLMVAGFLGLFTLPITVLANSIPIVDAGLDQTVYLGRTTYLNGTASDPDGDAITGWQWAIEDAPTGSTALLSGEFSAGARFDALDEGDYILSLIAYDGMGWSLPDTLTITYILNQFPTAVANASTTSGVAPLTVQFDATGSFDPEGGALTYLWDFGDATAPSLDSNPLHTYSQPGMYLAELIVQDDFGQLDFASIQINISAVPIPPAVWLFGSGLVGLIGVARKKAA
jgi:PKD repeat protein